MIEAPRGGGTDAAGRLTAERDRLADQVERQRDDAAAAEPLRQQVLWL